MTKRQSNNSRFEIDLVRLLYVILMGIVGLVIARSLAGCAKAPPEEASTAVPVDPLIASSATPSAPSRTPVGSPIPSLTVAPTSTAWAYPTPVYDPAAQWPGGLPPIVPAVSYAWDSDVEVFVALGSDYSAWRINMATGTDNTDVFIIGILQHEPARLSLVSVPRDLYVFIPGFGMSRINTAWKLGGPQMVADALRYNFGLPMDGYAYVRMEAFSHFIDSALGGIDVEVGKPVLDHCSDLRINYGVGTHHMDGATALCYARVRNFDGGFYRQDRQREILRALKDRFQEIAGDNPAVLAINVVEAYISEYRYTDLGVADLLRLVPVAYDAEIVEYQIDYSSGIVQYTHPVSGAWLVLPPSPDCMNVLMTKATLGKPWDTLPPACQ